MQLDDVHGAHGQARAVDQATNRAIKRHVTQAKFIGFDLGGVFLLRVKQRGDSGVAKERVVVKRKFGVNSHHAAVGIFCVGHSEHQRIDLRHGGVFFHKHLGQFQQGVGGLRHGLAFETQIKRHLARHIWMQSQLRIKRLFQDGLGAGLGHMFNLHAALGAGDQHVAPRGAVGKHCHVKFFVNVNARRHK